jgi:lysophospholipase L1-like esterase
MAGCRDCDVSASEVMAGSSSDLPLRIAGFGACMINGYPHEGGGLFEIACGLVEERLSRPVLSTVVSLGGFPAPRAAKHLKSKVFGFDPNYVVIQFGSTDAQCPLRARNRPGASLSSASTDRGLKTSSDLGATYPSHQPASALSALRWEIISVIGRLRKVEPITPLSAYIAAIGRMMDDCRSAGITAVVLSPFVYGPRYTTRNAISYTNALHELLRAQDVILVDCVSLLAKFPRSMVLQHDGFHLSLAGHKVVGEAIAQMIVTDARTRLQGPLNSSVQEVSCHVHQTDLAW